MEDTSRTPRGGQGRFGSEVTGFAETSQLPHNVNLPVGSGNGVAGRVAPAAHITLRPESLTYFPLRLGAFA